MSLRVFAVAALLALLGACASGGTLEEARPSGREQTLTELNAVVTGVDQPRRLLALRRDDGAIAVLPVAEEFRDFEKLRVGDAVVVSYAEVVAWQVKGADQAAPGLSARETLTNPKPGEAPGGAVERSIIVTATITALDAAAGTVVLTTPNGRLQIVKAPNPADLRQVHVGDLVEITFSEVRALAVRPAARQ